MNKLIELPRRIRICFIGKQGVKGGSKSIGREEKVFAGEEKALEGEEKGLEGEGRGRNSLVNHAYIECRHSNTCRHT